MASMKPQKKDSKKTRQRASPPKPKHRNAGISKRKGAAQRAAATKPPHSPGTATPEPAPKLAAKSAPKPAVKPRPAPSFSPKSASSRSLPAPQPSIGPRPIVQTSPPKTTRVRKPVSIPAILLEGDAPAVPAVSGPGERYALGPTPPPPHDATPVVPAELPEAYGTERLFLTARDPHWLYAAWDLSAAQRQQYHALSRDGHLVVRTYRNEITGAPLIETHLHPESKSWFIEVDQGGNRYAAELGYYDRGGAWTQIARSEATVTPPESISVEATVEFATIPPEVTLKKLFEAVEQAVGENPPLIEAVQQLRAEGWTDLPESLPPTEPVADSAPATTPEIIPAPSPGSAPSEMSAAAAVSAETGPATAPVPARVAIATPVASLPKPLAPTPATTPAPAASAIIAPAAAPARIPRRPWTAAQARALAQVVRLDESRRVWMGSLEITELIRRHLQQEISSAAAPGPGGELGAAQPAPTLEVGEISSPAPGLGQPPAVGKGFWLNVNAELVLYGATEPDARVTIGGRPIRLRPDGTFSYRFSLPDGQYPISITAVAADETDGRSVRLHFSRSTQHLGEVGAHPQDVKLRPPLESHLG